MKFTSDELQVINAVKYQPAVSIILPFDVAIGLKNELKHKLKIALDNAKRQLEDSYPEEKWKPVYNKLEDIITDITPDSTKKSIALFVSPVMSKVFFLDTVAKEKVIVNETFETRDLVFARQNILEYIALLIDGKEVRAFLAHNDKLKPLKLNMSSSIFAYQGRRQQQVANFADSAGHKEVVQDKFLMHIDHELTNILKEHDLPVLLMGSERLLGHFMGLSDNRANIVGVIHGNYAEANEAELHDIIKPHLPAIQEKMEDALFHGIEQAMNDRKLDVGIRAAWESANEGLGRMLIVEKNFRYEADYNEDGRRVYPHDDASGNTLYLKDVVDDTIEKVIRYGGEVRFVEDGKLSDYMHVALIKRY